MDTAGWFASISPFPTPCRRDAPDAAIYADGHYIIRFWNAGAERIFEFSEAEALGKSLGIIIPES
ncbi:MAG TPA: PAS domain-containing protein, partial [Stellaceae bacterium]|nr:PAS domain-containing protein [Stellaceae bacterium]